MCCVIINCWICTGICNNDSWYDHNDITVHAHNCKCKTLTKSTGANKDCEIGDGFRNEEAKGYCRVLYVGSSIFAALFTFYLAIDFMKSIGNNIRVRLGAKAAILALRSFLWFAYWNFVLNRYLDDINDIIGERPELEYLWTAMSGGNMLAGLVCSIIVLLVAIGYGTPYKRLHPFIARLLGFCLLAGIGTSTVIYVLDDVSWAQKSLYYAVASVLIVYDLQYL